MSKKPADTPKSGDASGSGAKNSSDKPVEEKKAEAAAPAPVPLTPREAATRDMKQAIELLQRAVDEEDFRLVARATAKTKSIRRVLTASLLRPLLEQAAPALVETLDSLAARAATTPAEEAEAAEAAAKAAKEAEEAEAREKAAAAQKEAMSDDAPAASGLTAVAGTPVAMDAPSLMSDDSSSLPATSAAAGTEPASPAASASASLSKKPSEWAPEVGVYMTHLLAWFALDHALPADAEALVAGAVARCAALNRRSMDWLSASCYYLQALVAERLGTLSALRPALVVACSAAARVHNAPALAVLVTAVLRSFLADNLYTQAEKFRANVIFPDESKCDTNAVARYLYYCGRIDAVQLRYAAAHAALQQALRKAPSNGAWGFAQAVQKHLILVELLRGDMPERAVFHTKQLRGALAPYLALCKAVRVGNVSAFNALLNEAALLQRYEADGTLSLVFRLRQNVIKTGLHKLTSSYSRMSLADVAARLSLPSAEDAELLTAKAIHDGVVSAVIDADSQCVAAKEMQNLYTTSQPKAAFLARIQYCLGVHEEATKALRYPASAHRGDDDDEGTKAKKLKEAKEAVSKAQRDRDAKAKSKDKDGKDKKK
jgi:26S proteasome regulatory subunit N3